MYSDKLNTLDITDVAVAKSSSLKDLVGIKGHYSVICLDANKQIKWEDSIENLVVTVGLNDMANKYFTGSGYTPAWYMGLVSGATTPSYVAGDTLASHTGWAESTAYTGTNRITVGFGAASGGVITSTSTSFAINATATIAGAFLTQTQSNSVNTGILFSEGSFTAGNRLVQSGDTLLVTYSLTL